MATIIQPAPPVDFGAVPEGHTAQQDLDVLVDAHNRGKIKLRLYPLHCTVASGIAGGTLKANQTEVIVGPSAANVTVRFRLSWTPTACGENAASNPIVLNDGTDVNVSTSGHGSCNGNLMFVLDDPDCAPDRQYAALRQTEDAPGPAIMAALRNVYATALLLDPEAHFGLISLGGDGGLTVVGPKPIADWLASGDLLRLITKPPREWLPGSRGNLTEGLRRAAAELREIGGKGAMVLATDGMRLGEIPDALPSSQPHRFPLFVVGLGLVGLHGSEEALGYLSASTGGYTVLAGNPNDSSYGDTDGLFMSVGADVARKAVNIDQSGILTLDAPKAYCDFEVSANDRSILVIVETANSELVAVTVTPPDGDARQVEAVGHKAQFIVGNIPLPVPSSSTNSHALGTWRVQLRLQTRKARPDAQSLDPSTAAYGPEFEPSAAVHYSLRVCTESNTRLHAFVDQSETSCERDVRLAARLYNCEVPIAEAAVSAIVTDPTGAASRVSLEEDEYHLYVASFRPTKVGIHRVQFLAEGKIVDTDFLRTTRRTLSIVEAVVEADAHPAATAQPAT